MTELKHNFCEGICPLTARLEPWMGAWANSDRLAPLLEKYGSPLNLQCVDPFGRNISALEQVAQRCGVSLKVYFARKANKCLSFVDESRKLGCGVDVASPQELDQVISRLVPPSDIICTAAIKETPLLVKCVKNGVIVALDNEDEIRQSSACAKRLGTPLPVAIRVSGFESDGEALPSRFGFPVGRVLEIAEKFLGSGSGLRLKGLHFHLDGYDAQHRVAALRQLIPVVDQLRENGHELDFIDMGGGFPMSYLDSKDQWTSFCRALRESLRGERPPLTFGNHGFGQIAVDGEVHGRPNVYPAYQKTVREHWLESILKSSDAMGTLAEAIASRSLVLRCEPGRSVLDGCGMTIAKVVFRKQHTNGDHLIGIAMNRTQCRTSHEEFMVDPIVVPGNVQQQRINEQSFEGYFVGAYCMESEFIFRRRMRFKHSVEIGDLVVIPNTAGYFMHFVESRSHQFPLAENLFVTEEVGSEARLDGMLDYE